MTAPMITPPGWYHDGAWLRWWDGVAWGPYAPVQGKQVPAQTEEERGKGLATLVHCGFIGGFILPLVVYLLEKDKNRYTRYHAAEALNFQISFGIAYLTMFVVFFIGIIASIDPSTNAPPPWPVFIFLPLIFLFMFAMYGLSILGMVKANRGTYWRYPLSIRFVDRQFLADTWARASDRESGAG